MRRTHRGDDLCNLPVPHPRHAKLLSRVGYDDIDRKSDAKRCRFRSTRTEIATR